MNNNYNFVSSFCGFHMSFISFAKITIISETSNIFILFLRNLTNNLSKTKMWFWTRTTLIIFIINYFHLFFHYLSFLYSVRLSSDLYCHGSKSNAVYPMPGLRDTYQIHPASTQVRSSSYQLNYLLENSRTSH